MKTRVDPRRGAIVELCFVFLFFFLATFSHFILKGALLVFVSEISYFRGAMLRSSFSFLSFISFLFFPPHDP